MSDLRQALEAAGRAVVREAWDEAWAAVEPHRAALAEDSELAWTWLRLVDAAAGDRDHSAELLTILRTWTRHPHIVDVAANQILHAVDGRPATDPIPDDDPARLVLDPLRECIEQLSPDDSANPEVAGYLHNTLGNAFRLAGTPFDNAAEAAYARALQLDPARGWWRFNLGLFYKNRGRFAEGLEVFQRVQAEVGDEDSVLWNIGICGTGCGDGDAAADAWRRLGLAATIGDDGLPRVDGIAPVKVRLSTGGFAGDDPGAGPVTFEHVWVAPLSPCHGVLQNPTLFDVGAELLDTVLFDGQSIGEVEHEGKRYLRFAVLARLGSGGTQSFRFIAERPTADALDRLEDALPGAATLYVFDDCVQYMCADCIRTGGPHRIEHGDAIPTRPRASGIVRGKLIVPRDATPEDLWQRLENDSRRLQVRLAVPALFAAMSDEVARRRHELLWDELESA